MSRPSRPAPPTPEQQAVLERIAAQRERLRTARAQRRQAWTAAMARGERVDPQAPLAARLWAFARLHPVFCALMLGGAALAGPARLVRWASLALPWVARWRR